MLIIFLLPFNTSVIKIIFLELRSLRQINTNDNMCFPSNNIICFAFLSVLTVFQNGP